MDLVAAKAEIVARLDREVMGGSGIGAPDRLASAAALEPVLDQVALQGWAIPAAAGGRLEIRRSYVLSIDRPGGGSYERIVTQIRGLPLPFRYPGLGAPETEPGLEIADPVMAKAVLLLSAQGLGPRPAGRLRDL